jgi:catechol 2,3-dioxygenase-like lactoylglutathione lyase family enzyme
MAIVAGIGGVFIYSNGVRKLRDWYQSVLGIETERHPDGESFYKVFITRDAQSSILRENPVFALIQAKEPLAESGRGFTLNLRVDELDQMLAQLRAKGVEVEPDILQWERGKHAWISDLDGNRIELYEEIIPEEQG